MPPNPTQPCVCAPACRCGIPPSYATKLVAVMRELQRCRQVSNVFAGKHGFITPRDLFRWAERGAVGYTQLAENGFMVLGERLRGPEERALVAQVLGKVLKVQVRCMPPLRVRAGGEVQNDGVQFFSGCWLACLWRGYRVLGMVRGLMVRGGGGYWVWAGGG